LLLQLVHKPVAAACIHVLHAAFLQLAGGLLKRSGFFGSQTLEIRFDFGPFNLTLLRRCKLGLRSLTLFSDLAAKCDNLQL
jgi:hypothetical protein